MLALAVAGCATSAPQAHGRTGAPRGTVDTAARTPRALGSYRLGDIDFLSRSTGYGQFSARKGALCTTSVALTSDSGRQFRAPVKVDSWPCSGASPAGSLAFDSYGDGFLYGPRLFLTHDNGLTWHPSRQLGTVLAIAPLGRSVWMLQATCPRGTGPSTCPLRLLTSANGGRTWQLAASQPPGTARGAGGQVIGEPAADQTWLVRTGRSAGYVLGSLVPNTRGHANSAPTWFTRNAGASWSARRLPCGLDAQSVVLSAAPDGTLFGICAGEPGAGFQLKSAARSVDGGRHWAVSSPRGPLDYGYLGAVSARSAMLAYLVGARSPLLVTRNGGRTWSVVRAVTAGSDGGTMSVQFVSPSVGFVLADDSTDNDLPAIWLTTDGGVHWSASHPKIS